jgi:hypothetical protein
VLLRLGVDMSLNGMVKNVSRDCKRSSVQQRSIIASLRALIRACSLMNSFLAALFFHIWKLNSLFRIY